MIRSRFEQWEDEKGTLMDDMARLGQQVATDGKAVGAELHLLRKDKKRCKTHTIAYTACTLPPPHQLLDKFAHEMAPRRYKQMSQHLRTRCEALMKELQSQRERCVLPLQP
jgi:hypothetical protein